MTAAGTQSASEGDQSRANYATQSDLYELQRGVVRRSADSLLLALIGGTWGRGVDLG